MAKLTTLKVRDMLAAYVAGETVDQIVFRFDVSRTTLMAYVRRHGLEKRRPGRPPLTAEQLAAKEERARARRRVEVPVLAEMCPCLPILGTIRLVSRPRVEALPGE